MLQLGSAQTEPNLGWLDKADPPRQRVPWLTYPRALRNVPQCGVQPAEECTVANRLPCTSHSAQKISGLMAESHSVSIVGEFQPATSIQWAA